MTVSLGMLQEEYIEVLRSDYRLVLVEETEDAASFYVRTARDDKLAVLVKFGGDKVVVSVKGTDQQLVNSFVDLVNSGGMF